MQNKLRELAEQQDGILYIEQVESWVEEIVELLEELKLKRSDDSVYGVGVLNGYSEAIDYIRRNGGKE